jgi:hypothetical protein
MRNSISSSKIVSRGLIAGLAFVLVGATTAHADLTVQQRAQEEMNRGKDYSAAWAAASHAVMTGGPADPGGEVARARRAEAALNEGKDYSAAWEQKSPSVDAAFTPEVIARAKRVREEIAQGKDYLTALDNATKAQPAAAPVVRPTMAERDALSAVK